MEHFRPTNAITISDQGRMLIGHPQGGYQSSTEQNEPPRNVKRASQGGYQSSAEHNEPPRNVKQASPRWLPVLR